MYTLILPLWYTICPNSIANLFQEEDELCTLIVSLMQMNRQGTVFLGKYFCLQKNVRNRIVLTLPLEKHVQHNFLSNFIFFKLKNISFLQKSYAGRGSWLPQRRLRYLQVRVLVPCSRDGSDIRPTGHLQPGFLIAHWNFDQISGVEKRLRLDIRHPDTRYILTSQR